VRHGVAGVVEALPLRVGERRRRLALDVVVHRRRRRRQGRLLVRGGERVRGHDEPPDAGAHLVEDVGPAAPALAAQRGDLLLVHLEVAREAGLLGQEPADAPLPPLPQGAAPRGERGAERGRRLGAPERPLGRRGGDGLDLAREGGQPLPQAHEVALLLATAAKAALEGGQLVLERPGRQEPRLLDVLQDGGHGRTGRLESSRGKASKPERDGEKEKRTEKLQWPSPALSHPPDLSLPSAFGVDRGWRRMVRGRYVYVMARCLCRTQIQ